MRRYLVKIAMQYGLMAQQIQSIDFDLLEKTINEYYAKAHAFYLKSVKDSQLDCKRIGIHVLPQKTD